MLPLRLPRASSLQLLCHWRVSRDQSAFRPGGFPDPFPNGFWDLGTDPPIPHTLSDALCYVVPWAQGVTNGVGAIIRPEAHSPCRTSDARHAFARAHLRVLQPWSLTSAIVRHLSLMRLVCLLLQDPFTSVPLVSRWFGPQSSAQADSRIPALMVFGNLGPVLPITLTPK